MRIGNFISLCLSALTLAAGGCASTRLTIGEDGGYRVAVNGEEVVVTGNQNLLEVLSRKATAFRLGEQSAPADRPLLLLDGVAMEDCLGSLAAIPAFHARSVTMLRPAEASALYGSRARKGAIIVRTR